MPSRTGKASDAGSLRSDAPFPYKDRRAIEDAQDAERMRKIGEIHAKFPYPQFAKEQSEAFQQMDKELNEKYKPIFKQELANRKAAKDAEAQAKADAKAAKDDERKRVAGIASGIVKGLAPQRQALTDRILEFRRSSYEGMRKRLEQAKGDLNSLFNGKNRYDDAREWRQKNAENLESYRVDSDGNRIPEGSYASGKTVYTLRAEPNTSTWHSDASRDASAIIDEFAAKIVAKTEEHAKARDSKGEAIVGTPVVRSNYSDPWAESDITVETTNRKITWRTNMILNRSKLDTLFNQWPTRLVSDEAK